MCIRDRHGPTHSSLVTHISVGPSSPFEGTGENGVGGVKLETARNPMEKLDRRQMALDGGRPQFLGSERVRHLVEQLPHVGQTVAVRLEKNGHTTTYPNVYPRAKMPLISAFRRGRNGDPHEFDACLLYTSPSPRDLSTSRMPSSA